MKYARFPAFVLMVLPLVLSTLDPAAHAREEASWENVLLVGWDGAQRAHVEEMLAEGLLPNLQQLAADGALIDVEIDEVTCTKAGFAEILTGYSAARTGVFDNAQYQPIPIGYTVFERLEEYFGDENIATLAVISKTTNLGTKPPYIVELRDQGEKEKKKLLSRGKPSKWLGKTMITMPGEPYYYTHTRIDMWVNGLWLDDNVGRRALLELDKHAGEKFFMFCQFAEVDSKGHEFGENSQEYSDALISGDKWLGRLRAKLKEMGVEDSTLVLVTADHGFNEGEKHHASAPHVFLAANDERINGGGDREDVVPTIYKALGIDSTSFDPPLDGRPLF